MAKKAVKKDGIVKKTIYRLFGAALLVFCVAALVSVVSYNAGDRSFNLASSDEVKNILGSFGSFTADAILRSFGFAFVIFLIAPMVWGYEMVRGQERINYPSRIFAMVVGVLSCSVLLALVPKRLSEVAFGGVAGRKLSEYLLGFVSQILDSMYGKMVLAAVALILTMLAFNYAAGITYRTWYAWTVAVCVGLKKFFGLLIRPFSGHKEKIEKPEKKERVKKEKPEKKKKEKASERVEPRFSGMEEEKKEPARSVKRVVKSKDTYKAPSINLLSKPEKTKAGSDLSQKEMDKVAADLENVLQEFGINGKIVKIRPGPVVTLYELEPAPGTKTARVIGLSDDIARSMSVSSVRIAVVAGSNTIGIEMPNKTRETVWLRELFEDEHFEHTKNDLNIVLGKDIGGKNVYADLAKMPHLLVAGTTGSGKSVGVNQMILSLLYRLSPEECKLIMIDPKMLEFSMYNDIPHLLTPVITDPGKAVVGLKWAVKEMEDRYRAMAQINVRNISGYNKKLEEFKESGEKPVRRVQVGFDDETGKPIFEEQGIDLTPLPYIVVVVDEMADLMLVAGKEVEAAIQRLAQMARAAGIHLIMSTQRPSVDVITGTIKANFPTRISFQVTSKIDSRTILGEQGAEQLLGRGDMLYMPAGQRPIRIHGSFVPDHEIEQVVEFLKAQKAPEYVDGITEGELGDKNGAVMDGGDFGEGDDGLYAQAVAVVQRDKKASTSYIQRKLRIGYNRAASIIDKMEEEGIVTPADHVGRREVV